jgi:hypothetical protein
MEMREQNHRKQYEYWDDKWMMNWRLFVRILSWSNFRCYYVIFLYGLNKRTKIIIQDSRSPGRGDDCRSLSNLSRNSLIASDYVNRIEKEINSRRIITSQEFVESSCENVVRDFVGVLLLWALYHVHEVPVSPWNRRGLSRQAVGARRVIARQLLPPFWEA